MHSSSRFSFSFFLFLFRAPRAEENTPDSRPVAAVFLSAAKPTDQGEESVVLLVVVVVVGGGGTIFKWPMYSFLRCEK